MRALRLDHAWRQKLRHGGRDRVFASFTLRVAARLAVIVTGFVFAASGCWVREAPGGSAGSATRLEVSRSAVALVGSGCDWLGGFVVDTVVVIVVVAVVIVATATAVVAAAAAVAAFTAAAAFAVVVSVGVVLRAAVHAPNVFCAAQQAGRACCVSPAQEMQLVEVAVALVYCFLQL